MIDGLPRPFPAKHRMGREDSNPGIRLFGRRFFQDQSPLELVAELLAVVSFDKQVGAAQSVATPLPDWSTLLSWPDDRHLQYHAPVRLNLKLFALLQASRVDLRHDAHRKQHELLTNRLKETLDTGFEGPSEVVEWFEELFRGFQGAGLNRAWCAQVFLPITAGLISRETIWAISSARRDRVEDWDTLVENASKYFRTDQRAFLARGGELLYLQLCNALRTGRAELDAFLGQFRGTDPGSFTEAEADPTTLHGILQTGLASLNGPHTRGFDRLVDVIEGLDPHTSRAVNRSITGDESWLTCEWCPQESWPEGYLFAVELSRLLRASLDPIERLEMLITGCTLQVLRSLCAQSARYSELARADAPLGYAWILVPPSGDQRELRQAAHRNLQVVQGRIQNALRHEALEQNARQSRVPLERLYREADNRYGHKLLLSLGKKLGFITPKTGPGAKLVMTDDVLRYLVVALLRPGERCTLDSFLERLYLHYGIAIEGRHLDEAAAWSGLPPNRAIQPSDGSWLATALRAGGFLAELSDACSVVRNTYAPLEDEEGEA